MLSFFGKATLKNYLQVFFIQYLLLTPDRATPPDSTGYWFKTWRTKMLQITSEIFIPVPLMSFRFR